MLRFSGFVHLYVCNMKIAAHVQPLLQTRRTLRCHRAYELKWRLKGLIHTRILIPIPGYSGIPIHILHNVTQPALQIILSLLGTGFINPNPTDKSGRKMVKMSQNWSKNVQNLQKSV